jgi:hypothetical protein
MNWVRVFNRLFTIINIEGDTYFSGSRFISKVREIDPYFANYSQYIEQRNKEGKSTSRKDYYYDILMSFDDTNRLRLINGILSDVQAFEPEKVAELKNELGGIATIPSPDISKEIWSAERLSEYLKEIDIRIGATKYAAAITLAYTCLEGFLKAFVFKNMPDSSIKPELLILTREVQAYLKSNIDKYPDEAFSILSNIAHTVDRSRNKFSESHFDEEAARWIALFVRDMVNAEIRLLLHFM